MDAQFVDAENEDCQASFAIASFAVFEGPAPTCDEFYAAINGRLALVPIHRRKLREVPFRLGSPVWVDDPNFDLRYHIRQTALPAPGGDEQLSDLIARVMAQRLDRDFPRWEYWLVEGLSEGRCALISKVHHRMVDGISGTDLHRVIFDLSPEPPPVIETRPVPAEPTGLALAASAAVDMAARPAKGALALAGALARPLHTVRQASRTARAVTKRAVSAWPTTGSSFSGPIGRQRRYTWARASLAEVKEIKPLYGLGRPLVEIIPYVPIATNLRTVVSIFTYCGQMTFGITGGYATTADIDVLARGIEHGIRKLAEAAQRHQAGDTP